MVVVVVVGSKYGLREGSRNWIEPIASSRVKGVGGDIGGLGASVVGGYGYTFSPFDSTASGSE